VRCELPDSPPDISVAIVGLWALVCCCQSAQTRIIIIFLCRARNFLQQEIAFGLRGAVPRPDFDFFAELVPVYA
jgi:hypothetical protein